MHKTVLVVDIGTHRAQEFEALFVVGKLDFLQKVLRHRVGCLARKEKFRLDRHKVSKYLSQQETLKDQRDSFFYVFVEPNQNLFQLPIYSKSDASFNVALSNDSSGASIVPLYLADEDLLGQGSSLYENKPNVDIGKSLPALNVDVEHFAWQLKNYFEAGKKFDYSVVLRINNEGAESDAIRAFERVFQSKLQLVLGSLKDVGVIKGESELKDLEQFMKLKNIAFVPFHSRVTTWEPATTALLDLAKN